MANLPTSSLGRLCMPKICSHGNFSNSPSLTIASAPPRPSSAGWKMRCTVPSKLRVAERYLAAPSSMVVWPSWPQACMRPLCWLRWSKVLCSSIGSASMSARRPIARGLLPTRIVPTTPVLPMPVVTSRPHSLSFLATIAEVRSSSKPSSGWAWMSRRMAVSSAAAAAILGSILADIQDSSRNADSYTTELAAMHVGIEVAAVRQDVGPGMRDQAYQFLGEIKRRHHVVAGADRERRCCGLSAAARAGRAPRWRRCATARSRAREWSRAPGLGGGQILVVVAHPRRHVEGKRARPSGRRPAPAPSGPAPAPRTGGGRRRRSWPRWRSAPAGRCGRAVRSPAPGPWRRRSNGRTNGPWRSPARRSAAGHRRPSARRCT